MDANFIKGPKLAIVSTDQSISFDSILNVPSVENLPIDTSTPSGATLSVSRPVSIEFLSSNTGFNEDIPIEFPSNIGPVETSLIEFQISSGTDISDRPIPIDFVGWAKSIQQIPIESQYIVGENTIFLTSPIGYQSSWTVPNNVFLLVSVEAIGGGSSGNISRWQKGGAGGGGGAYAILKNYSVEPGQVIPFFIGSGNLNGGASWFGLPYILYAPGAVGQMGGSKYDAIPFIGACSGGNGGISSGYGGGGGGAAGGPNSDGGDGGYCEPRSFAGAGGGGANSSLNIMDQNYNPPATVLDLNYTFIDNHLTTFDVLNFNSLTLEKVLFESTTGGTGGIGINLGGAGGDGGNLGQIGDNGEAGLTWGVTFGPGGGGGGAGISENGVIYGGSGGLYGAGGGGGSFFEPFNVPGGQGSQGIIKIVYQILSI